MSVLSPSMTDTEADVVEAVRTELNSKNHAGLEIGYAGEFGKYLQLSFVPHNHSRPVVCTSLFKALAMTCVSLFAHRGKIKTFSG